MRETRAKHVHATSSTPALRWATACLAATIAMMTGPATWAQVAWDPDEYVELTQRGQTLYEEAMELPNEASARRRDLLMQSAELKQLGLEMLRTALLTGQVEGERDAALQDFYVLSENLIVTLIDLDQCAAAELLLAQALAEPALLPEGGADHLRAVTDRLALCYERVESGSAYIWDPQRYQEQVEQRETWRYQAQNTDDERLRRDLLFEASHTGDQALNRLRTAILEGRIQPGEIEDPNGELFEGYDFLVDVLLEQDLCNAAARRIEQAQADGELIQQAPPPSLLNRENEIAACRVRNPTQADPEAVVVEEDEGEVRWLPIVLFAGAGVALVSALIVQVSSAGDRDEADRLQEDCDSGTCDQRRLDELNDSIDGSNVASGVLVGVGLAAAIAGTLVIVLDDDGEAATPESAQVHPWFGPEAIGVSAGFRF